ncbi:MAG: glycosyltransferase family 2 protein [Bacteroidaceae bacterium]|nr:glycosyltransferase family 2 protein [Bacteroidaceae bacterium]
MNSPKISVILPVYNTEKYLHHCIDSILAQTFTDFELLLIDDGSKDGSGKICDEYSAKDSRIRVFHKENGGVSSARNLGLRNAQGEWIIFIDSDDWISGSMLLDMYEKAISEKSDIVYCDLKTVFNGHTETLHIAKYDSEKVNMLNNFIKSTFGTVVGMLAKRRLYESNQVRFPIGVKFCEDFYVAVRLMLFSEKICYIPAAYYCYNRQNETSASCSFTQAHSDSVQWVLMDTIDLFQKEGFYTEYAESLSWRLLKCKQDLVLDKSTYNKFLSMHPDSHKYIWSCPYLNLKIKIMMWSLVHHMRFIAWSFLLARNARLKFSYKH